MTDIAAPSDLWIVLRLAGVVALIVLPIMDIPSRPLSAVWLLAAFALTACV